MCNKRGRIMHVTVANHIEEVMAHRNKLSSFVCYWRTNRGTIRMNGYVWICKCGRNQRWARTKKKLIAAELILKQY